MSQPRLLLALMTLGVCILGGCDEQAAQFANSQAKLDSALDVIAVAHQGYVPGDKVTSTLNIHDFRNDQLQTAEADLKDVVANGSPEQKQVASRLLANVYLSNARYLTRDASAQYAGIAARSSVLLAQLKSVERSAARVSSTDVDYDAKLEQLAADASELSNQNQALQGQADTLADQIAEHQAAVQSQRSAADTAMAEARKSHDAAFVVEGKERLDLQAQADVHERKAGVASAEAEKHQIQIDTLTSRLNLVNTQLQTLASQIAEIKQQSESVRQQQAAGSEALKTARAELQAKSAELKAEYDQLAAVYDSAVSEALQTAANKAEVASQLLVSTGGATLLTAHIDHLNVLAQRASIASGWASTVGVVSAVASALNLPDSAAYQQAFQSLAAEKAEAAAAANDLLVKARELAATLANDSVATAQAQRLETYAQQLRALPQ